MSAIYDGQVFRTALEARWAAFFDLAGWRWRINPDAVGDWAPDFLVEFPCGHSECSSTHALLVAVLPINQIDAHASHPALSHRYGLGNDYSGPHSHVDAGALFGNSPEVTNWQFAHGAGGGVFDVRFFVTNADELWIKAANQISRKV